MFTRKCMVVFARQPKKVPVITRWLYYRGGHKAGFHCTKFKKLRKVYNLPFFSVLGHFFYPKFPLTSLTKIPSMFLFSTSVYLKEIKTKKMSNIYIKIIIHVLHVYLSDFRKRYLSQNPNHWLVLFSNLLSYRNGQAANRNFQQQQQFIY